MKLKRYYTVLLILLSLLGGHALAVDEQEVIRSQAEAVEIDEIEASVPDDARELLDGVELDTDVDFAGGLGQIFNNVAEKLNSILRKSAKSAATVLVIAVLCGLVNTVYEGSGSGVPSYVPMVGVLAITAATVGSSGSFIALGTETLDKLETFSKALLPTLATVSTASGAVTSATVKYGATVMFMDVLLTVTKNVLMPVIYAYIAASVGSAAFGGGGLDGAAGLLKWIASTLLTTLMLAFVTYVTVIGVVSGSADAATTRVAKAAISTALPVVGGIISDAAGTVLAGAGMVKNAIGVVGLLVVLSVCLIPILHLGAHYLMFKAAAGLGTAVTDGRITKLIGSLGTAFGMVMGIVGAGAVMLFFSIISMMQVVTG